MSQRINCYLSAGYRDLRWVADKQVQKTSIDILKFVMNALNPGSSILISAGWQFIDERHGLCFNEDDNLAGTR